MHLLYPLEFQNCLEVRLDSKNLGSNHQDLWCDIYDLKNLNQLDLRFAVGLTIHISSDEPLPKLKQIHSAFVAAKAKSVFVASRKCLIMPSGEVLDDYVPE